MLHFRQFRHLGHADDFQHLGDIDAVIAAVDGGLFALLFRFFRRAGIGQFLRRLQAGGHGVALQDFVEIELDDFQLVGACLKQNIGLGHSASEKNVGIRRVSSRNRRYIASSHAWASSISLFGVDAPAVRPTVCFS